MASQNSLVVFFSALAAGSHPQAIPRDLRRVARGLFHQGADEAEDLVGDFLVLVLDATRRGLAGSAAHLLHLGEPALRAVVRHRMQQLLAQRSPCRKIAKQLRDAVRRALRVGLPNAPADPPTSLVVNDKLSMPLIADAVAYVLTRDDAPSSTDANAIADRLRDIYFGGSKVQGDQRDTSMSADDQVAASVLAKRIRATLDADLLEVLRGRVGCETLEEIARAQHTACSTAHGRLARVLVEVRAEVEAAGVGRDVGEVALEVA